VFPFYVIPEEAGAESGDLAATDAVARSMAVNPEAATPRSMVWFTA